MSYTLLTGLHGAVYAGGVVLLGAFRAGSDLSVAGSTLVVAALSARHAAHPVDGGPAVQPRAVRRGRTVDAFVARLRDNVDLDELSAELITAVHATVQPARASLWLRQT